MEIKFLKPTLPVSYSIFCSLIVKLAALSIVKNLFQSSNVISCCSLKHVSHFIQISNIFYVNGPSQILKCIYIFKYKYLFVSRAGAMFRGFGPRPPMAVKFTSKADFVPTPPGG